MIKPIDKLTFVFDNPGYKDKFKLFSYFDEENIPIEYYDINDPLQSDVVYYPIRLGIVDPHLDYLTLISPRAIELAQENKLVIVFIYEGNKDVVKSVRRTLMTQMIQAKLSVTNVRFISADHSSSSLPPFIYFPFAELSYRAESGNIETKVDTTPRSKRFTYTSLTDTEHSRLFGASIWYHSIHNYTYFDYPSIDTNINTAPNAIRNWTHLWSTTGTLMDMFGMHIPFVGDNPPVGKNIYNDSYWNLVPEKKFLGPTILSDRIFKPIMNLQPFIIIGPAHSLALLHSLGYLTFDKYINEIYDTIENDEARMQALFRLTYELANINDDDHNTMLNNVRPILEHNQQNFVDSKKFRLINLLNQIKET